MTGIAIRATVMPLMTSVADPFRALKAGILASVLVMLAGTVLGTLRELVVAPRTGEMVATLLELPFILGAGWLACAAAAQTCSLPAATGPRLTMGAAALVALLGLEVALATAASGATAATIVARYREPAAQLGLAAQALYAAFPLLQARLRRKPR